MNDFNATVIVREIPAAQTQLMKAIQIFDDDINEARETFEVALQIVSNISNVVSYRRRTTLCRIRQSDRKSYLVSLMYSSQDWNTSLSSVLYLINVQFTTIVE